MITLTEKVYSIGYLLQKSMPLANRMGIYLGINKQYEEVVYVLPQIGRAHV